MPIEQNLITNMLLIVTIRRWHASFRAYQFLTSLKDLISSNFPLHCVSRKDTQNGMRGFPNVRLRHFEKLLGFQITFRKHHGMIWILWNDLNILIRTRIPSIDIRPYLKLKWPYFSIITNHKTLSVGIRICYNLQHMWSNNIKYFFVTPPILPYILSYY